MSTLNASGITIRIKQEAVRLGFDLVGTTEVRPSDHARFYKDWIAAGRHGEMAYLARADAVARRLVPPPAFRSAVVVAMNYYQGRDEPAAAGQANIAQYARGRDYHKVLRKKLLALLHFVEEQLGRELPSSRAYVDTGPVLERELAQRAGLGWFGRNTMLINPKRGSYFFLGTLLLEVELEYDEAFETDHCGTCNACIEACPTGALLGRDAHGAPVIDATRCISYLTIEQRGPIPRELRPLIGNRVFGCDICQQVCPFTRTFSVPTREPDLAARAAMVSPSLVKLMGMSEDEWDEFSRGSAVRRARREGFMRNVAVALGNGGSPEAVPTLVSALSDPSALVRRHVAWALGRIETVEARAGLAARLSLETDELVLEEIRLALAG